MILELIVEEGSCLFSSRLFYMLDVKLATCDDRVVLGDDIFKSPVQWNHLVVLNDWEPKHL